jgi:hypothetical protein
MERVLTLPDDEQAGDMLSEETLQTLRDQAEPGCLLCTIEQWEPEDWD